MANIVVVGGGLMGSATAAALRDWGNDVLVYDTEPVRSDLKLEEYHQALGRADYVVSIIPTPPVSAGFSLSILEEVFRDFRQYAPDSAVFVQRSTTIPGTARKYARLLTDPRYLMWPCFAYRATATEDETCPKKIVVGGQTEGHVRKFLQDLNFPEIPDTFIGSWDDAETAKIASNTMQALMISAWNSIKLMAPDTDSDFVMATVVAESSLSCTARVHGKAFGKGGRLYEDVYAWSRTSHYAQMLDSLLGINESMRTMVGEQNAHTKDLKVQLQDAVSRRVSLCLGGEE